MTPTTATATQEAEASETLIPCANFEVRSLAGKMVPFPNGYVPLSGFGIWDKEAKGWVCMSKPLRTRTGHLVDVPYTNKRMWIIKEAIAEGLWSGYRIVKPEGVVHAHP